MCMQKKGDLKWKKGLRVWNYTSKIEWGKDKKEISIRICEGWCKQIVLLCEKIIESMFGICLLHDNITNKEEQGKI